MSPARERVHAVVTTVWAVAALVHLVGNPAVWFGGVLPTVGGVVVLAVAVLAGAVALRPDRRGLALALVVAVWLLALVRLPVLPNNLVLLGVLGIALLASRDHAVALATVVRAGAAAYLLAAFAKYNSGFLDPSVSCAPVILDRLVGSWGFPALPRAVVDVTPVLALVTETAVGIGLVVPRARRHAAALGIAFHGLLAYDLDQHFWDFTAVLLVLFAAAAPAVTASVERAARSQVRPVVWRAGLGLVVVVAAATSAGLSAELSLAVGHVLWWTVGSAATVAWLLQHLRLRRAAERDPAARWSPVAVVLVVLVVANGLTPYLQLKSGYGWNMYSNLSVAGDDTNHLFVPAMELRDDQRDLVTVVDASQDALQQYVTDGAMIARSQLVDWVVRTDGAEVTVRTASGEVETLRHGDVTRTTAAWVTRIAPLRPVQDTCLLTYGPAG